MIIKFIFENFRSFKTKATLDLEAENLPSSKSKVIKTSHGLSLLPSAGIFGANASGKSNLFKALAFMRQAMLNSDINNPTVKRPLLSPFELDNTSKNQPTLMEIILWDSIKEREYRYGFRVNQTAVIKEWLFVKSKVKTNFTDKKVFDRDQQKFDFGLDFKADLVNLPPRVNQQMLALPIFAQFNHSVALDLIQFLDRLSIIDSQNTRGLIPYAIEICDGNSDIFKKVIQFVRKADTGIQDIKLHKITTPLSETPISVQETFRKQGLSSDKLITGIEAWTEHKTHDQAAKKIKYFDLYNRESGGTVKLFILATLLIHLFENKGGVLLIDELDAGLHPLLVQAIINQIERSQSGKQKVQLIYSSHATYLLSRQMNLRRDQIWFTEKTNQEASILKCLSKYKTRNDYEIARNYLIGKFGAVPILDFEKN